MELIPKVGLGLVRFGMRPSEVKSIFGLGTDYEPWMGGNLNDSLLYPGIIAGFDKCDSRGPLEDSRLVELRINQNADIQFFNKSVFELAENELRGLLEKKNIRVEERDGYLFLPELNVEFEPNESGRIVSLNFWCAHEP